MGVNTIETCLSDVNPDSVGQSLHVPHMASHYYGKAGDFWPAPYETHPVAPEEPLEGAPVFEKGCSSFQVSEPSSQVAEPES